MAKNKEEQRRTEAQPGAYVVEGPDGERREYATWEEAVQNHRPHKGERPMFLAEPRRNEALTIAVTAYSLGYHVRLPNVWAGEIGLNEQEAHDLYAALGHALGRPDIKRRTGNK